MSLGYVKGKSWVTDDYYRSFTEWESYKSLVRACREAGFTFNCEYSYTTRRYMAEVITLDKIGDSYYTVKHGNAYDEHPMLAITAALRTYHPFPLSVWLVCVELDARVIAQKLLPIAKLEQHVESLLAFVRTGA